MNRLTQIPFIGLRVNFVEVNGGVDWVIPTLEFNGRWREGKVFDEKGLAADLKELGLELS